MQDKSQDLPGVLALGVMSIIGVVLAIRGNDYVEAARAAGCGTPRIMFRHILPHIAAPIIVIATISLGNAILAEASLSFLGFGIPPPTPTWGGMLSMEGREFMMRGPWLMLFPGAALSLAVFGFNMLGDGLRGVLDPKLRGTKGST